MNAPDRRVVVDASAAIGRLFGQAPALPKRAHRIAPVIWWYETRNALVTWRRQQQASFDEVRQLVAGLDDLGVDLHPTGGIELATLLLAERYGLTAYDASYLALAHAADAELATQDRKLAAAAQDEGISLAIA